MFVPFLLSRNLADLERVLFSGESVCFHPQKGRYPSMTQKESWFIKETSEDLIISVVLSQ